MLAAVPDALSERTLAGAVTATVKVFGVPTGALIEVSVTTQLPPAAIVPGLRVTTGGTGDAVPSRKVTL